MYYPTHIQTGDAITLLFDRDKTFETNLLSIYGQTGTRLGRSKIDVFTITGGTVTLLHVTLLLDATLRLQPIPSESASISFCSCLFCYATYATSHLTYVPG
ncbi:hypothetical protein ONE63_003413 [Megalurothrips usitatus]|uniref:Uncharacterized protein n=1 Tax=Megalurothrips usitatus TaxID=439358 RepID=A0AAV7XA62_9NEOP|nr:hypothetical protein ONE63_003413 [Megalurothrips usitatus]